MISNHLNRFTQALVLAVVVAVFAVPAVALGKPIPGTVPDVFERYAAAHPFGGVRDTRQVPDVVERYAAAHPFGQGVLDTRNALVDGRSPDTLDAAATQSASSFYTPAALKAMGERYQAAATFYRTQQTALDGRSPDTRDAAGVAQLQIVDGRSPDTLDASTAQLRVSDGRSPDTMTQHRWFSRSSSSTPAASTGQMPASAPAWEPG